MNDSPSSLTQTDDQGKEMSVELCDMFECLAGPTKEVTTWDCGTLFLCDPHTEEYQKTVGDWLDIKKLP